MSIHHELRRPAASIKRSPSQRQPGRPAWPLPAIDRRAGVLQIAAVQRLAGNAAVTRYLQRDDASETTSELSAESVRATAKDETAAVIWRDQAGAIAAVIEFESNATLAAYQAGTVSLDKLLETNRAIIAQQSVDRSLLKPPASPAPSDAAPAAATDPAKKSAPAGLLAKLLETAFKQLRTARILILLANKRDYDDAQKAVSSTLAQLKRLKREASALRNRIEHSGGGAKVTTRLAEAEAEIAKATTLVEEQKAVLREAQAAIKLEQAATTGFVARLKQLLGLEGIAKAKAGSKLWKFVGRIAVPRINALVALLESSTAGAKILSVLRKLQSPAVARVIIAAAAILEGVQAYLTSKNTTTPGKVADAVITGGSEAMVVANPVTALADLVLPKKYKLSTMYRGGAGAITALGEGIFTGDTTSMENFHEASKRGEYGMVMQLSSEAGDYWAEHGVIGGLQEFGKELWDWR